MDKSGDVKIGAAWHKKNGGDLIPLYWLIGVKGSDGSGGFRGSAMGRLRPGKGQCVMHTRDGMVAVKAGQSVQLWDGTDGIDYLITGICAASPADPRSALISLCATVEAAGGLTQECEEDSQAGLLVPLGDPTWIDLVEPYLLACLAMNKRALVDGEWMNVKDLGYFEAPR